MRARIFVKHPDLLTEMLLLRLQGWSEYALARKYEADKSTVEHWCDKFGIEPVFGGFTPVRQVSVIQIRPVGGKQYKYQHLFDEENEINEGRDYAYYRVQGRKRDLIKHGTLNI